MAGLFGSSAPAAPSSTTGDTSKDYELENSQTPKDGISDMMFNPQADFLAVSSWDGKVYIYEVNSNGANGKWIFKSSSQNSQNNPSFLSVAWSTDGTRVAAGDVEGAMYILDLRSSPAPGEVQATRAQAHGQAVKSMRWFNTNGQEYLATGSWDKKVKMWDGNNGNMVGELDCAERVYTMDVQKYQNKNLMVIGTAERHIQMVDLNNPTKIYKTIQSPLKWQTRVVSCFTDASGFAVGSVEGRCAIQYVDEKDTASNFSFKCHRQQDPTQRDVAKVYSVNAISFHPTHGTFSTAGSDGTFHFWDKDAKHRLKGYPEVGGSITATAFSRDGNIFAYAVSYDWSKGYSANRPDYPIKLRLHPIVGDECKPRPGSKKR